MIIPQLKHKLKESVRSVFPVVFIILSLSFTIAPQSVEVTLMLLVGTGFIIVGIAAFTLGAEMAMTPMGDALGSFVVCKKKLWFLAVMGLFMGFIITIAEPGLLVLAEQVTDIPSSILVATVAAGVGVYLAIAFFRTVFNWPLKYILFGFYAAVFILAFFVPESFLPVAFDAGGATTGAMTVPFIMALGVAVARTNAKSDNFGLIAICSIGPIITVMLLGLIYTPSGSSIVSFSVPEVENTNILWGQFMNTLPTYIWEVGISLAPIVLLFTTLEIFAMKTLKIQSKQKSNIIVGIFFTFGGLALFLTGANVGFVPMGNLLGRSLAEFRYNWLLIPIGMVIGFFMIAAEPAVHVLNKQVADVTNGAVSQKTMGLSLGIGVAIAIGVAMLRVLTHIPIIWVLLPGYVIAIGLSFFAPKDFTSIAFDAGGVASGPLTSAFLLPLAIGASTAVGGNVVTDAFGLIAMVALTPLITIQVLGLLYHYKVGTRMSKRLAGKLEAVEMLSKTADRV